MLTSKLSPDLYSQFRSNKKSKNINYKILENKKQTKCSQRAHFH